MSSQRRNKKHSEANKKKSELQWIEIDPTKEREINERYLRAIKPIARELSEWREESLNSIKLF